ncbi:nucleoside diphosphate kinase regulator [Sphingosinicella humi]|uniref:Nucleoside diphosphate kinase regulator n=1 Tax=Allosphingosinicella humi TaxID=2068657 RepID=A0A2U2J444_9SPHN|nr:nucleoside diphosphate kinase regulator [Sphingosinicella humi]PWG03113.1 nucleoside diphosphate kinase regulator [Sphingosinicella humi]
MAATRDPSTGARPPIHLLDTESDLLGDLALRAEHRVPVVAAMLLAEIERAEIHDEASLPKDAITLGSEIDYVDEASGAQRTVQLVLPAEADIEAGRISVMTPMGAGLIGLSTGQTIEWPDLEGRERRITIQAVRRPKKDA